MEPTERFNTGSHLVACCLALAGLAWLLAHAHAAHAPWQTAAVGVFGLTALLSYAASVLFHGARPGARKLLLERIDHAAIHSLIAGTATPFLTGLQWEPAAWGLLAVLWGTAAWCAWAEMRSDAPPSLLRYLLLGWWAVAASACGIGHWSAAAALLLAGAGCYSLGAWFYRRGLRRAGAHGVWHVAAMCGTGCHFFAVAHQIAAI